MGNIPDEHFLDIDNDMLDFLEKQGEECIRDINQSTMINKENGYKLLSILIVGIGSSFFLLTQNNHPMFLKVGIAVFMVYWSFCAIYLVRRVLSTRKRALASSTPYELYHKGYKGFTDADYEGFRAKGFLQPCTTLNIMRRYRLRDLTEIADFNKTENTRVSRELDRVRIATILTPICALIIYALIFLSA